MGLGGIMTEPEPVPFSPCDSPRRILALDLGTTTGWALQDGSIRQSGVWNLRGSRFEGGGMRFVRFKRMLNEIGKVDLVAYEEVRRHMGVDAAHVYGGMQATLTAWCEEQATKSPYEAVPVQTIKKYATGKGNAKKEMMMAAFTKRTGRDPIDDNEADAWWLLDYAMTMAVSPR
jgi:hypothetical protein